MTADREQTRRDAELIRSEGGVWWYVADRVLALLAELAQAERVAESVPALVEALRQFYPHAPQTWQALKEANTAASNALADYEQSQGGKDGND